jgi:hypothetical protein
MADIFRSRSAVQITTHLTNYYAALDAVAAGQGYSITSGGVTRVMTKANMNEIVKMIELLENSLAAKSRTSVTTTHVKIA